MQPNQLDPVASERLSHADKLFTSDLSINEFALLHGAGFAPIELVMGVSVYHVGYQFTGIKQQSELPVLTEATYRARWNAMARMQAEADALGADGVVGVRLDWRHQGEGEHLEFIAVGTAVRYTAKPGAYRRPNGQAFTSHLSGQDMTTLLRSGCTLETFTFATSLLSWLTINTPLASTPLFAPMSSTTKSYFGSTTSTFPRRFAGRIGTASSGLSY